MDILQELIERALKHEELKAQAEAVAEIVGIELDTKVENQETGGE